MMRGVPASPGLAAGPARVSAAGAVDADARHGGDEAAERARAAAALAAAGAELEATASSLRAGAHGAEAEIVEAGALMALDPALSAEVDAGVGAGFTAAAAIVRATGKYADTIAALEDPNLAARADDVLSFGRRASRLATLDGAAPPSEIPAAGAIVVADDLGPADVADLQDVAAVALAGGGPTAHAAIVARSLGVPMVVGLGTDLLAIAGGTPLVVDGATGDVLVDPDRDLVHNARAQMAVAAARRRRQSADAALPAVTRDGVRVRVLTNAAGPAEVDVGLAAGAEGVGLLRTELAFLDSDSWPTRGQHAALLDAIDAPLVTVRLLDFGGDKTPPFLRGVPERGIALLLAHPDALAAQLDAIGGRIRAGRGAVRVLIPLIASADQVDAVRAALPAGAQVGAMVETPEAAGIAPALAQRCAFLSVGTNDLTNATLGTDRFNANASVAHHPRVLAEIRRAAQAAHAAGIPIEVCGEAASDPVAMPMLVGLGVDELSVGAARVGAVRAWVRALDAGQARDLAQRALRCVEPGAVADLVRAELGGRLDEAGEELGEPVDGGRRVGAVGP
ncbi:Phosphoenolpyruvate-protein phosphotransferase [Baekduia alba]|uniref:putative PEP-binding protein n=1 Tax=Baekduia alba TaxID=2997333 RepID=UPI002341E11F|nr:putative PEP-binding protein [Baekduia alba]WCB92606.1 Phosphoenolpyruvate-protein phosphotransferase [Baekduia alba]